jgi:hypothetical protein
MDVPVGSGIGTIVGIGIADGEAVGLGFGTRFALGVAVGTASGANAELSVICPCIPAANIPENENKNAQNPKIILYFIKNSQQALLLIFKKISVTLLN